MRGTMTGGPGPDMPLPPAGHGLQRAAGTGRVAVAARGGATRLSNLYQEGCARIRLPRSHGAPLEAVLVNTAGGLTGGDVLEWAAEAGPGARLSVTTQACERVYRALGHDAKVTTRLTAGEGARIDWLPQETILFDRARLDRRFEVDLAPGATLFAIEAVVLGRHAMGEAARAAQLTDRWQIRREGRLIHAEATVLDGSDMARDGLSLLAGSGTFATLIYIADDAEAMRDRARAAIPEGARAAVSAVGERLVIRILAVSGMALRTVVMPLIALLTRTGAVPRLWTL